MLPQESSFTRWFRSTPGLITLIVLLVVAGYFLIAPTEYVSRAAPYVLLLLCPLLHLFMHRGHGGHNEQAPQSRFNTKSETPVDQREHSSEVSSNLRTH
jgi:hypothetical protein